jgi:hypothetical protein
MAERVGFEPTEDRSSTVFKTAAFGHSATSPRDFALLRANGFQDRRFVTGFLPYTPSGPASPSKTAPGGFIGHSATSPRDFALLRANGFHDRR